MRILRLTQRLPPLPGGLEVHARELSLAQAARGAQVEILFAEGDPVNGEGVTSHRLAPLGEHHALTRRWSAQQRFGAAVSRVTKCAFGTPQLIHAHGDYALAAAALRLGKRFHCPVILTVHGGLSDRPWHRALSRAIFPKLHHALAVSEDIATQLHDRGLPRSRITVLPSGIHRSRFRPLAPEQRTAIRTRYGITCGSGADNDPQHPATPTTLPSNYRKPPLCAGEAGYPRADGGDEVHPQIGTPQKEHTHRERSPKRSAPYSQDPVRPDGPPPSPNPERAPGVPAPETFGEVSGKVGEGEVLAVAVGRLHPVKGYRHLIEAMHRLAQDAQGCSSAVLPHAENPFPSGEPGRAPSGRGERVAGRGGPEHLNTRTPEHLNTPTLPHTPTPLHLILVGSGPEETALRSAARDLPNVTFTGALPPAEVAALLGAADLFIHPAVELGTQREGTPTSVLEALAAGLPVITTTTGGLPALIRDGDNGRLVPPADPTALAAAMRELAADPALRAAQSERNRLHPACRDWEEVAGRLLDLYASLMPVGSGAAASPVSSEAAW